MRNTLGGSPCRAVARRAFQAGGGNRVQNAPCGCHVRPAPGGCHRRMRPWAVLQNLHGFGIELIRAVLEWVFRANVRA
jgi:hypothetical protein